MFTPNRTKFTVIVGSVNMTDEFKSSLVNDFSAVAGGCTAFQGTGYWKADAEGSQELYTGELAEEEAFKVEVSTDTDAEEFYGRIQGIVSRNVIEFGIEAEWIHVEAEQVKALHFPVSNPAEFVKA